MLRQCANPDCRQSQDCRKLSYLELHPQQLQVLVARQKGTTAVSTAAHHTWCGKLQYQQRLLQQPTSAAAWWLTCLVQPGPTGCAGSAWCHCCCHRHRCHCCCCHRLPWPCPSSASSCWSSGNSGRSTPARQEAPAHMHTRKGFSMAHVLLCGKAMQPSPAPLRHAKCAAHSSIAATVGTVLSSQPRYCLGMDLCAMQGPAVSANQII